MSGKIKLVDDVVVRSKRSSWMIQAVDRCHRAERTWRDSRRCLALEMRLPAPLMMKAKKMPMYQSLLVSV